MDIASDFKSFQDRTTSALVRATKTAGHIALEDLSFQRSSNVSVGKTLDTQSGRLLRLANRLTKYVTSGSDAKAPQLKDLEDVEDNWRGVVDVIDDLLERTDACLDEFTGVIKRLSPSRQDAPSEPSKRPSEFPSVYKETSLNRAKPQLLFESTPDNFQTTPFKPLLTSKPHAITSLTASLGTGENGFNHPYSREILQSTYPSSMYEQSSPEPPQPLEPKAVFVDTPEALYLMLSELKTAKEIAIDLEHHDLRSYVGIVSLMQISTRNKDWIVDTLKPWRLKLQALNKVFANPKILKVLHGSFMDIIWLQRDFGVYVVNLFDTFHASEALGLQRHSLKFLLERYCNVSASKKYQTADWRTRPLTPEMLHYARCDTHYLLYIFDCMRNELVAASTPEENLVNAVLEKSKQYALQKYERPVYDAQYGLGPGGWESMLSKSPYRLSHEQAFVFKAVHQWRDKVARTQDDSVQYVMSNQLLFAVAQEMPLDGPSLHKACRPMTATVRTRASELLAIIKDAKTAAANSPKPSNAQPSSQVVTSTAGAQGDQPSPLRQPWTEGSTEETGISSRAQTSQFWGNALPELSLASTDEPMPELEGFKIALPIPELADATIEDAGQEIRTVKVQETTVYDTPKFSSAPAPTINGNEINEIFTLKQLGGSRKRKAEASGPSSLDSPAVACSNGPGQGDEDDPVYHLEEDLPRKAAKAGRGAKRKAKKRREMEQDASADYSVAMDDTVPFDYDKAKSVLHAKPDVQERRGDKSFDPYAKALDAPQGMKKLRREMPGKSVTYH